MEEVTWKRRERRGECDEEEDMKRSKRKSRRMCRRGYGKEKNMKTGICKVEGEEKGGRGGEGGGVGGGGKGY
ncbi:hypothetical protein E2C01_066794 [Portunus trituberculatus]|uniref:Uncharacterized protein n=1 Tax=Portunus trituberculatus TaxID=210409 RepID=A0A5B7HRX3_PORTR|nr:hypothetical protein [Portunus trituberculatus]